MDAQFASDFRVLTRRGLAGGYDPMHWQGRLFEAFNNNCVPSVCDLPTGLGKTTVLLIWLLAIRRQLIEDRPRLPLRLVYVVDRRTVVDQATELASQVQGSLPLIGIPREWLSISTLRGQLADNREWTADPSRAAIIIGTIDMIGSRLLFSGYRSSYKLRPLDAGLLGQDTLLVLDEAHLSGPFEKLVRALGGDGAFQRNQGRPMKVMCMSATAGDDGPVPFRLLPTDLAGDPNTNPIVQRYEAKKRLILVPPIEKNKIRHAMVEAAAELVEKDNARVVVFTQKPEEAAELAKALRRRLSEVTVEALTGTMRGLERDELLEKAVMKRFLDGEERPEDRSGKHPAVLVSTSAGEVGFDLNADHMICDAAPFDSMIQRLGRVNRRGYGDANVRVYVAKADDKPGKKGRKLTGKDKWGAATEEALRCLGQLALNEDGTRDASPQAIDLLKRSLSHEQIQAASAPRPDTVELTDILLDAWSMTTIAARMPGRPPVASWLRGLNGEGPQTTIAWRSELDIEGFGLSDLTDIEDWFDAHRVMPHETLSVPTYQACEWMLDRWEQLSEEDRLAVGDRPCIVDRGGLQLFDMKSLVDELKRKLPNSPIVNSDIVVPASFGGIQRKQGLLDPKAPAPVESAGITLDDSVSISDVADTERGRYRLLRDDALGSESPLVGAPPDNTARFARLAIDLPGGGDTARQLISLVPKKEWTEYGTSRQSLQTHVSLVEKYAGEIAGRLSLSGDVSEALRLASKGHDGGKDREVWQRAVGRTPGEEPVGKSGGSMRRIAGSYRHEFGSMREFTEEHRGKTADDVFDLAMHLIAVHHGRGRPHFPKGGFDPDARAESAKIALESVRRFARLQRLYGYWQLAWLENLLRCADAMASAEREGQ